MTFGKSYANNIKDYNSDSISNITFGKNTKEKTNNNNQNENKEEDDDLNESVIIDLDMISISHNFKKFYRLERKGSYLNTGGDISEEENSPRNNLIKNGINESKYL